MNLDQVSGAANAAAAVGDAHGGPFRLRPRPLPLLTIKVSAVKKLSKLCLVGV